MGSNKDYRNAGNLIVVQLVELLINSMAFRRVDKRDALVKQSFELTFEVSGHILAGAIGTGGVGLVPVMGVMNIFQPAAGHDRDFVGALCGQVGRPGQTKNFD